MEIKFKKFIKIETFDVIESDLIYLGLRNNEIKITNVIRENDNNVISWSYYSSFGKQKIDILTSERLESMYQEQLRKKKIQRLI